VKQLKDTNLVELASFETAVDAGVVLGLGDNRPDTLFPDIV